MDQKIILYSLLIIFTIYVKCEQKEVPKSKKPSSLPYFRRKVEELGDGEFFETTETNDHRNLVSFLVKNVKEIFGDLVNTPETINTENSITLPNKPSILFTSNTSTTASKPFSTVHIRSKLDFFTAEDFMSSSSIPDSTHTNDLMLKENLSVTTLKPPTAYFLLLDKNQSSTKNATSTRNDFMQLAKDFKIYGKADKKQRDVTPSRGNTTDVDEFSDPRRSCIMCNNVAEEDCNDPRNKLITSIMCERDDDLCYSLHTPFGIVDRGCFNVNHNLTTYVCSCNLCNYLSISEMPFMFAKKRDWVDNVIELSRTKHFRKSVFNDMSCLKCEVNTTTRTGDMLESANCLEGNIGNLPVEDCNVDEICAVKALRADGYIWRGCIKAPLYNYWWVVCDRDLCNYDNIVNLYNYII